MRKLFILLFTLPILFTSCNKEENAPATITQDDLIGIWTASIGNYDILINEQSLADFFGSQQAAELALAFAGYSLDDISNTNGTIEFRTDATYTASGLEDPGIPAEGPWEISEDNTTLLLNKGTESEVSMKILTSNNATLTFNATNSTTIGDIDDDGTEDYVNVTAEVILAK